MKATIYKKIIRLSGGERQEIIYFDDDIDPEDLTCPACHEKIACLVDEDDLKIIEGEDK